MLVLTLDQQPVFIVGPFAGARLEANKRSAALQALSPQCDFERYLCQPLMPTLPRRPCAAVPDDDRASAIARGDHALEACVVNRVILGANRKAFVRRIEAWPSRDRPGEQHAIKLKPEVVVQACGVVLLDDERCAR